MATSSVDTTRSSTALQTYTDALFVRDSKKLYFGDDGDVSMTFNGTNFVLDRGSANVVFSALPSSDPGVSDALYAVGSDLLISQG